MRKYNCKVCGAELYFDAATQKLKCDYCGSMFAPFEYEEPQTGFQEEPPEEIPEEPAKTAAEDSVSQYTQATDDSTGELAAYSCAHCGAQIITAATTVATTCVYCNRAVVLEGNVSGDFKPDYVLPFVKEKKEVETAYTKMCKSAVLAPKEFKDKNTIKKIKGMYIPYWLHTMHVEADLDIRGVNQRIWSAGDSEYTETSIYRIEAQGQADYQKISTDALKGMDDVLMDSLEPYDFKAIQPFQAGYLAGYYTQRYDEEAEQLLPRAKERARNSIHAQLLSNAGSYGSLSVESEDIQYSDVHSEYAMMPVWMMYTQYKNKDYVFGMNGQTGRMVGDIPKDYKKALLITGGVFLGSQVLLMLLRVILALLGGGL
ncbi:MAG: hypothetical protein ACK5MN_09025 [Lachnospiraceae bacterium]